MNRKILTVVASMSLFAQNAFSLGSGGIGTEILSTRNLALGGTIQSPKHDPITVYSNPALIGDGGPLKTTVGVNYVHFSAERSGAGVTNDKMESQNIAVPNFAFSHALSDGKFGVGLAIVSPYGLATNWGENSSLRYIATESRLETIDITPAVSYRHNDFLAVGFGADFFFTDASIQKKINGDVLNVSLGGGVTGARDVNSELKGDGEGTGYHTSIAITPNERNQFSATYHSEVETRINGFVELKGLTNAGAVAFGGANFNTGAVTKIYLPQNVQLGYMRNGERWTFLANAAWYDWSKNQQLFVNVPTVQGLRSTIPLDWKDVWSFSVATAYQQSNKLAFNFSAYYLPGVTPDQTFSPLIPDLDRYGITFGPSIECNNVSLDLIYNPIFFASKSVTNNHGAAVAPGTGASVNGDYEAMVHIVGLNFNYRFN